VLKPKEIEEITNALWYIPLEKLQEVRELVLSLKDRFGYDHPIDDSDEWTDEDRREWTEASIRRLEQEDPWPEDEN
jgi:hypothetical protein